jgi:serine/threonine-protein kinase
MPDLCLKVVGDPPLSLAGLRPDVSRQMVDVVERCLRKEPAERFANAAELASALEGLVPPASRVVAARARLAMGISASAPAVVVAQTMAAPLDARPRPSRRWIVIGAVGAVAAAALIVGARFAGAPASARLSAASAASTASAAAVTAAPDPASPPAIHERTNGAVVLQAPAATVAPAATEVTPAVSTAVSSAPAPASSAPKLPARVAPSPSAPPHVAPGKKPGGHDDDIPSFR